MVIAALLQTACTINTQPDISPSVNPHSLIPTASPEALASPVAFVTAAPTAVVLTSSVVPTIKPSSTPMPQPTPTQSKPTATPLPTRVLVGLPTSPPINTKPAPTAIAIVVTRPNAKPAPTQTATNVPAVIYSLPTASVPTNLADANIQAMRDDMLQRHNRARVAMGLKPLTASPLLQLAAQRHADECAQAKTCSHVGANGSTTQQRIRQTGYNSQAMGENWAWARTAATAWEMWFDQEFPDGPHRLNILSKYYRDVGFGIAFSNGGYYFITNFGGSYQ